MVFTSLNGTRDRRPPVPLSPSPPSPIVPVPSVSLRETGFSLYRVRGSYVRIHIYVCVFGLSTSPLLRPPPFMTLCPNPGESTSRFFPEGLLLYSVPSPPLGTLHFCQTPDTPIYLPPPVSLLLPSSAPRTSSTFRNK